MSSKSLNSTPSEDYKNIRISASTTRSALLFFALVLVLADRPDC